MVPMSATASTMDRRAVILVVALCALLVCQEGHAFPLAQAGAAGESHNKSAFSWSWDTYTHVTAVLALIITLSLSYIERRRQNRLLRIQRLVEAESKYDDICKIRAANPQYLRIAGDWHGPPDDIKAASNDEIGYHSYVEMTLGFIETYVYLTYSEEIFSKRIFKEFIEPMIWLEVSYNLKAFRTYYRSNSISMLTCAYLSDIVSRIEASATSGHDPMKPMTMLRSPEDVERERQRLFRKP